MIINKKTLPPVLTAVFAFFALMAFIMVDLSYGAVNNERSALQNLIANQNMAEINFDRGFDMAVAIEYIHIQSQASGQIILPSIDVVEEES